MCSSWRGELIVRSWELKTGLGTCQKLAGGGGGGWEF